MTSRAAPDDSAADRSAGAGVREVAGIREPANLEVAVLEIGGTHVTGARVATRTWQVVAGTQHRSPLAADAGAAEIVGQLLGAADRVGAGAGAAWGIAIPGPFDYHGGIALFTGVGKFDSLHGHDLGAALWGGMASRPGGVIFLNDGEAFVVGEWLQGAATGLARCAGITVGTGVGSAFIADGRIVDDGPTVPPGGRLHRLVVDGRPLEDLVSRRAILRRYHAATGAPGGAPGDLEVGGIDVGGIADRARDGDRTAGAVLEEAFRRLGTVIAPWLQAFQAEVLVVGGGIARSWDLMGGPLQEGLGAGGAGATTLRPASHPETSPLVGAAWAAVGPRRFDAVAPRPAPA